MSLHAALSGGDGRFLSQQRTSSAVGTNLSGKAATVTSLTSQHREQLRPVIGPSAAERTMDARRKRLLRMGLNVHGQDDNNRNSHEVDAGDDVSIVRNTDKDCAKEASEASTSNNQSNSDDSVSVLDQLMKQHQQKQQRGKRDGSAEDDESRKRTIMMRDSLLHNPRTGQTTFPLQEKLQLIKSAVVSPDEIDVVF